MPHVDDFGTTLFLPFEGKVAGRGGDAQICMILFNNNVRSTCTKL